ncbi:hypothetical protein [Flavobacterium psychrophilum]|uniref:hypothetical protein n=1 Tax=Flavobacterium psychrophilum TaxID=96345 RepID=UPI000B7C4E03|nr:hypothetical protein [Flavobacterium psychrophilum]SNB03299.1 hypothetical protein FPC831_2200002 [Flavobacterium psychrophilum]
MALSWNEIKERAVKFSKEWADYSNEEADAKLFLVEFFNIFGIYSNKVATFEHRVKKLDELNFVEKNLKNEEIRKTNDFKRLLLSIITLKF